VREALFANILLTSSVLAYNNLRPFYAQPSGSFLELTTTTALLYMCGALAGGRAVCSRSLCMEINSAFQISFRGMEL